MYFSIHLERFSEIVDIASHTVQWRLLLETIGLLSEIIGLLSEIIG